MFIEKKSSGGFTLVEIAIVMVIVGLLIGGILQGQKLIEQAKINRIIKDIESYRSAYHLFQKKYNAIPGDLATVVAQSRIANCTAANFCAGGNNDGRIGVSVGGGTRSSQAANESVPRIETTMFWKHLALADLISGINTSAPAADAAWGETHPRTALGAGFIVMQVNTISGIAVQAPYLRIQTQLVGQHSTDPGTLPLTPLMAAQIDRKLDDGVPRGGWVVGDNVDGMSDSGVGAGCEGWYYLESNDTQACFQLYKL